MPQSQGIRFTANPLTFIVRQQLWDANVEDHSDQGASIEVAADMKASKPPCCASTASISREATSTVRRIRN